LLNSYNQVFPHGNRNAASHRWSHAVLEEAESLSIDEIDNLFTSFCPVSGSPLRAPDATRQLMELSLSNGEGSKKGFVHFCCWPCVCDTNALIKVDPTEIKTKEGMHTFDFLVIGNPCSNAGKIPIQAPDVTCDGSTLEKASFSANNHVIIGLLHPFDESKIFIDPSSDGEAGETTNDKCEVRARSGYRGGMGEIFRDVALIQPLTEAEIAVGGDQNLLGGNLQSCSDPNEAKTGWQRSGYCNWDASDSGYHGVCVEMTQQFLDASAKNDQNDLSSVVQAGGHWCICAWAWASAVKRDPENYEGLKLLCEKTNSHLVQVYESNAKLKGYLTEPALAAVKSICGTTSSEVQVQSVAFYAKQFSLPSREFGWLLLSLPVLSLFFLGKLCHCWKTNDEFQPLQGKEKFYASENESI